MLVLDHPTLQCKLQWAISLKMISGYNFWLECPTKVRSTQLSYIFKALYREFSKFQNFRLVNRPNIHIIHVWSVNYLQFGWKLWFTLCPREAHWKSQLLDYWWKMQFNIDLLFAAFCQFCVESRLFWPILDKKKHRLDWTIDDRNTDWQKDKKKVKGFLWNKKLTQFQ